MNFLHAGLAVAGIACVAIPIIIHLLMRRRRKPVMWGAMRFLLEAYKRQRRKLMLEKWLLLLTRCLVVLLAGLAIARPLLAGATGTGAGGRTVYLLVDNGLAAQAGTGGGSGAERGSLARHKELAAAVVGGLGSNAAGAADRVALIAMGGPAQAVVLPASSEVSGVGRAVEQLDAVDSRTDLPGALALAASAIQTERDRDKAAASRRTFIVILSDFLEGSADPGSAASAVSASLVKLPSDVRVLCSTPAGELGANLAITSVDPARAVLMTGASVAADGGAAVAGGENVRVTLRRSGGASGPSAASVRLFMEQVGARSVVRGRPATALVRFAPGQDEASASVQVPMVSADTGGAGAAGSPGGAAAGGGPAGGAAVIAQIEPLSPGADLIPADSMYRRPVEVREVLRVAIVSPRRFGERARVDQLDSSEWLRLALRPGEGPGGDTGMEVVQIEPAAVDPGRLVGLDAIVLPRPDLIPDDAWRRLGGYASAGGMVIVMPPGGEAGAGVQLWPDKMVRELGLPWSLAREPKPAGTDPTGSALVVPPVATSDAGSDLLGVLRGEAPELARAVRIFRTLPMVDAATEAAGGQDAGGGGERLLTLSDGAAFVWAGSGGERAAPTPTGATGATPVAAPPEAKSAAGRGLVVYFASAMELGWTDLPARPLMLPLLQELIKQGVGRARGSWWTTAGRNAPLPGRTSELVPVDTARVEPAAGVAGAGSERLLADAAGQTTEPVRRSGLWRAVDDRGGYRGLVAVNADWRGGRVAPIAKAEIERWLRTSAGADLAWLESEPARANEAIASALSGSKQGPPISLPLLIAAGLLALGEMWLARWASHAGVDRSAGIRTASPAIAGAGTEASPA